MRILNQEIPLSEYLKTDSLPLEDIIEEIQVLERAIEAIVREHVSDNCSVDDSCLHCFEYYGKDVIKEAFEIARNQIEMERIRECPTT